MSEIWKDIVGYEEYYEVSSMGRVRNKKTMRVLKQQLGTPGYFHVQLKGYTQMIHVLVAKMFISNPKNKNKVDHIDRNKLNNNYNNLRWVSHSENMLNKDSVDNAKNISKNYNKFVVHIQRNNILHSERFKTEAEAIEWRDKKLIELASLNNDE